ncbi:MAG: ABC-type spermidine/putrescine transport system, ATPase component [Cyanobacteria bacterium RYN_339]|nr:ABC-type spermidine/putrescine transport system, ATPase component [Cyanobacteria bacterium RYN_339]
MAASLKAAVVRRLPDLALDVELELLPGTITALVGPSGAGKTTLLRCLAGLERLDAGEIRFGAEDWTHLPPQARGLGMVFRPPSLFPHLTARANVAFGARGPVDDLLARLELEAFADRYPRQLSAGEQQRVAIARALATRPRLLLMDEPFTALDGPLERRLHEAFRAIAHELGAPVLLVTHDLAEACWLGDRLGVLAAGKLLQIGPPDEVVQRPTTAAAARLVGVTNLYPGDGRNGHVAWGPYMIEAPAARAGALTWGIRPERVDVAVVGTGNLNELPGLVTRLAPWSGQARLAIEVPQAGMLEALLPPARVEALGLRAGAEVRVGLPPAHVLVLPT